MIKTLRLAALAALVCTSTFATADTNVRGRVNHPAHANYTGLRLPYKTSACTAVTGQLAGDACVDSTAGVIYIYNGTSFYAAGSVQPSQILSTLDPATTGNSDAVLYSATTGWETDDKFWAVGSVGSIDKEGDLICVKETVSGQATFSGNPAGTTAADASVLVTVTGHAANEKAFATSDSAFMVDKEGDTTVKTLTIDATALTVSGAELNKLDGAPIGTSTISCADDAAGTTSLCTVQLKDADGADLAVRGSVFIYLSADANGDAISVAPSGGWAITTDGLLISQVTNLAATFISESDGDIDFTITEAAGLTLYVIMILPNGKLIASSALVFDA